MSRQIRRLVSLLTVVAMSLVLFAPTAVHAVDYQSSSQTQSLSSSSNLVFCTLGENVSSSFSKDLQDVGIDIKNNTLIEFISSEKNSNPDTIVVTNIDGSVMEKAFITSVTSDGTRRSYSEVNDGYGWNTSPMDDSFTLVIMVEYNRFSTNLLSTYYYQPVNALFIYYDRDNLYKVNSAEINYECGGYEYTIVRSGGVITGYTPVSSGPTQYTHSITINTSSPNKNTYYGGNNPYNTNRVIDPNLGPYAAHILYYDIYITPTGSNKTHYLQDIINIS